MLKALERVLLIAGVALGVWVGMALTEARYFKSLPVPAAARTLPGEDPSGEPTREPAQTGAWVARLEAPSIDLSATVLEGSDEATLARAAGRIEYTARPGEPGNIGIAGHRDTTFRPLRDLKVGDALQLTTADRSFEYRVTAFTVVDPQDVHVLDPTPQPTLTLVTCYPFTFIGSAPRRFIVTAVLVDSQPRSPALGTPPAAAGQAPSPE